jgi:hypothetical protein
MTTPPPDERARTRLLYVSPLRALAVDVEKNLRSPLVGIAHAAERARHAGAPPGGGHPHRRHAGRRAPPLVRHPPDLLITTPESLYLMLTSAARETLANVEAVIIDEIHALAGHQAGLAPGAHPRAARTERCERPPQRIGLSATQRPLEEVATFLGGFERPGVRRPVTVVDAGVRKPLELVGGGARRGHGRARHGRSTSPRAGQPPPARCAGRSGRRCTPACSSSCSSTAPRSSSSTPAAWPSASPPGSTSWPPRATEERRRGDEPVGAGEGPPRVAVEGARLLIEDELKSGRLRGSGGHLVARARHRHGRGRPGDPGRVAPARWPRASSASGAPATRWASRRRGSCSPSTAPTCSRRRWSSSACTTARSSTPLPPQPARRAGPADRGDVRARRVVGRRPGGAGAPGGAVRRARRRGVGGGARPARRALPVRGVRRAAPPHRVGPRRPAPCGAGPGAAPGGHQRRHHPRPRPVRGVPARRHPRRRARRGDGLRVAAGRDLPARRVHLADRGHHPRAGGRHPGARPAGEDAVLARRRARRPLELGAALGAFVREVRALDPTEAALERLRERHDLDERAATNLLAYLDEQAEATGAVPDDRTIVVERFRDEIGDWRVCVLTPFGAQVHAPWAMALRARLAERWGVEPELMWSDDGIVLRLPEAVDDLPLDELLDRPRRDRRDPGGAPLAPRCSRRASARPPPGRCCCPAARPDRRTPLWQQRQKAADLLAVAADHPSFPILLETTRECCNDVFDLPALRGLLRDLRSPDGPPGGGRHHAGLAVGPVAAVRLDRRLHVRGRRPARRASGRRAGARPRPAARAARRRGAARPARPRGARCDRGRAAAPGRRASGPRRRRGDRPAARARAAHHRGARRPLRDELRGAGPRRRGSTSWRRPPGHRRGSPARSAGRRPRTPAGCATRSAARSPSGCPPCSPIRSTTRSATSWCATPAPTARSSTARSPPARRRRRPGAPVLDAMVGDGRLVRGEFRPGGVRARSGATPRCCASSAAGRSPRCAPRSSRSTAPRSGASCRPGRASGCPGAGVDGLVEVLSVLAGAAMPASVLESDVLPGRSPTTGPPTSTPCAPPARWCGWGRRPSAGRRPGAPRVPRPGELLLVPDPTRPRPRRARLHDGAARHLADGARRSGPTWSGRRRGRRRLRRATVLAALWDLVWAGEVTNDSLAPLRAFVGGGGRRSPSRSGRPRPGRLTPRSGAAGGAGRWSLVAPLLPAPAATPTEVAHARATQLLERYGVLTREAALGEGIEGGFAGVYPVLKALEERGTVRRGYFVAGLGAAQFALPGAVDRLRSRRGREARARRPSRRRGAGRHRPGPALRRLAPVAPTDGRPARAAGALVVLVDGEAAVYVEKGGTQPAHVPGRTGRPPLGRGAGRGGAQRAGAARSRSPRSTGPPPASRRTPTPCARSGFADGYKGSGAPPPLSQMGGIGGAPPAAPPSSAVPRPDPGGLPCPARSSPHPCSRSSPSSCSPAARRASRAPSSSTPCTSARSPRSPPGGPTPTPARRAPPQPPCAAGSNTSLAGSTRLPLGEAAGTSAPTGARSRSTAGPGSTSAGRASATTSPGATSGGWPPRHRQPRRACCDGAPTTASACPGTGASPTSEPRRPTSATTRERPRAVRVARGRPGLAGAQRRARREVEGGRRGLGRRPVARRGRRCA